MIFTVVTTSLILYSVFLREERLALIDQQVRDTATALLDSELGEPRVVDFDRADAIISDELGESRIGKFFVIRNGKSEIVYESASAKLLPIAEIPRDQQWFQINKNGKFIRGLNLKLPRVNDRTLQVGLLLDESILNPGYSANFLAALFLAISLSAFVVSYLLTTYLMRPIARLGAFIDEATKASRKRVLLPVVPAKLLKNHAPDSRDEFIQVVVGLGALIERINKNYQMSRLWTYQMAHELKTPLSRANLELERLQREHQLSDPELAEWRAEGQRMSETINSFLGWAELENSSQPIGLFRVSLNATAAEIAERLDPQRVRTEFEGEAIVVANRHHVEQLLQNLVQNALLYSPGAVTIRIQPGGLCVEDEGPGLGEDVTQRLGEPFNRGGRATKNGKGHGLGLAWVVSICKLYDWELSFSGAAHSDGSQVVVKFPLES